MLTENIFSPTTKPNDDYRLILVRSHIWMHLSAAYNRLPCPVVPGIAFETLVRDVDPPGVDLDDQIDKEVLAAAWTVYILLKAELYGAIWDYDEGEYPSRNLAATQALSGLPRELLAALRTFIGKWRGMTGEGGRDVIVTGMLVLVRRKLTGKLPNLLKDARRLAERPETAGMVAEAVAGRVKVKIETVVGRLFDKIGGQVKGWEGLLEEEYCEKVLFPGVKCWWEDPSV